MNMLVTIFLHFLNSKYLRRSGKEIEINIDVGNLQNAADLTIDVKKLR